MILPIVSATSSSESPGSAKSMPRPSRSRPRERSWLFMYSEAVRRLSESIMMPVLSLVVVLVRWSLRHRPIRREVGRVVSGAAEDVGWCDKNGGRGRVACRSVVEAITIK